MRLLIIFLSIVPFLVEANQPRTYKFTRLNEERGLTNNVINDIAQDTLGFIWVATDDGLFRYDGRSFESFRRESNRASLPNNFVHKIYVDHDNQVWALTDYGMGVYDYSSQQVKPIVPGKDGLLVSARSVNSMVEIEDVRIVGSYRAGLSILNVGESIRLQLPSELTGYSISNIINAGDSMLWIGTVDAGLLSYRLDNGEIVHYDSDETLSVYDLQLDSQGHVWIGTNRGLYLCWDSIELRKVSNLPDDEFLSVLVDENEVWLGTRNTGLILGQVHNLLDANNDIAPKFFDPSPLGSSISHRTISKIFKDKAGSLWLGTHNGGINVFNPAGEQVDYFTAHPGDSGIGMSYESVWGLEEHSDGKLWIGTDGNGLDIFDPSTNMFNHERQLNLALPDKAILSILHDSEGYAWLGTYNGGLTRIDEIGNITNFSIPVTSQDVRCIFESRNGRIWIGTNGGGLFYFDDDTQLLIQAPGTEFFDIRAIKEGDNGILWLGTWGNALVKYGTHTYDIQSFDWYADSEQFTPVILSLYKSENYIWIGTRSTGLVLFDIHTQQFEILDESKGLINNTIRSIISDERGSLWLSTNAGVSAFNTQNRSFTNFLSQDGFMARQFNDNSAVLLRDGRIAFGGIHGLNIFNPHQLLNQGKLPEVRLKSVRLMEGDVNGRKNNINIFNAYPAVSLEHNENFFEVSFAAISFPINEQWSVESKLVGYEEDWSNLGRSDRATYRNVPPGNYELQLRVRKGDARGSITTVPISIAFPWWRMWYAYTVYLFSLIGLFWLIFRYNNQRLKLSQNLLFEQKLRVKEQEQMEQKLRFFTNFSHELRTPLTLISSPVDDLLLNFKNSDEQKKLLNLIRRNSRELMKLVNRLLEFRKFELEKTTLNIGRHDINILVQEEVEAFHYHARHKKVQINLSTSANTRAWLDIEKLQIILNNLLSNALKYVQDKGNIWLELKSDDKNLMIGVKDDGVGIDMDEIKEVFKPFYQARNSATVGGTGIGLSLCKSLVKAHGGTIYAQANSDGGSNFIVRLPNQRTAYENRPDVRFIEIKAAEDSLSDLIVINQVEEEGIIENVNENILVVADDNLDIGQYLKAIFEDTYKVLVASNGDEAIDLINKYIPDLVISDIMMPKKDGVELCQEVKSNEATSHIPVILLTAKDGSDSKILGFESGADDYVTKPFRAEVIKSRVRNLIQSRSKLKSLYGNNEIAPDIADSEEMIFLKKVESMIVENASLEDFSVPGLARDLGYSRTSLYRKIKALTDLSINQFMRSVKMKRASEMLATRDITVSEVAFSMGFTDLKYFRSCFKAQFGILPSDYQKQNYSSEVDIDALKSSFKLK